MEIAIRSLSIETIPYQLLAFLSVCVLAFVHFFANKISSWDFIPQSRFLSAGGGVAIAYVFIDLLPKLCVSDDYVTKALAGIFYFERHVFIVTLFGFLLFFIVDRIQKPGESSRGFWVSLSSYALFNFLMGYAIADPNNPEVQPLLFFTLAMSLHYFTNDYSLNEAHGDDYKDFGRWVLILTLFLGWIGGNFFDLSETAIALVSAFIGGGVIMNVIRHELPMENPNSLGSFLTFACLYTIILLSTGV